MVNSAQGGSVARRTAAVAAGVGIAVGVLGRGVPDAIVAHRAAGRSSGDCGDEGIVECAVVVLPEAVVVGFGELLLLVALYAMSAVVGAGCLAVGLRVSVHADLHPRVGEVVRARLAIGPLCVLLGACLLVPTVWVVVSAVASG